MGTTAVRERRGRLGKTLARVWRCSGLAAAGGSGWEGEVGKREGNGEFYRPGRIGGI
jgi:hypothetical protein